MANYQLLWSTINVCVDISSFENELKIRRFFVPERDRCYMKIVRNSFISLIEIKSELDEPELALSIIPFPEDGQVAEEIIQPLNISLKNYGILYYAELYVTTTMAIVMARSSEILSKTYDT